MIRLEPQDDSSLRFRLTIEEPDAPAKAWDCRLDICPNATCHCRDVKFVCQPEPGAAGGAQPAPEPLEFWVDPFLKCECAKESGERRATAQGAALGRRVAAGLSKEQWGKLLEMFRAAKARAMASFDPDQACLELPFEAVEREGAMLGYYELLPHAEPIVMEHGDRQLALDDQYCLRPDCDCREALVALIGPGGPNSRATAREALACFVDYDARSWREADSRRALDAAGRELRLSLERQHPDIYAQLRARHALLKRIYRASAAKLRPSAGAPHLPAGSPKVGRNDPCPCGSGKKYKKCCGR